MILCISKNMLKFKFITIPLIPRMHLNFKKDIYRLVSYPLSFNVICDHHYKNHRACEAYTTSSF